MGKKTSIYLPDSLDEAIRASGQTIPDLIRIGLEAGQRTRADRLAETVERLLVKLDSGYTFVAPTGDKAALAAELAELAERMNKLSGEIGP
jgi:hypothetical protein